MTSLRIVYRACLKWHENGGARHSAALAYYALFSIAPLMLIAVYTSAAVFGEDAAKGKVRAHMKNLMEPEFATAVEKFVQTADVESTFGTSTISILFLIAAALGAFLHLRAALCTIWKLDPPKGNTFLGFFWNYVLSLFMVFITAAMLLLSLGWGLVVPVVEKTMHENVMDGQRYWHWIEIGASFVFLTLLLAVSYRIVSGGRIAWKYVVYGSFIAAMLLTIGKTLLSYYLVYTGTASMYGAAGSVVVFLMWVYYSAQILFFGAELIQARRTRHEWMNAKSDPEALAMSI